KENTLNLKKLAGVVKTRFPKLQPKIVSVRPQEELSPQTWIALLSNAKLCFYLCSKPFEWGTLALESLFYRIPTVFPEENQSLNELLPQTSLSLARFLINQSDMGSLKQETERVVEQLKNKGLYEPLATAATYRELYRQIMPSNCN
ncbi:MAG: hypothetical protein EB078_04465, partial [Proteobacteria bacterium]|nr:hypothetical protein [Pseudomonadota bacterium]